MNMAKIKVGFDIGGNSMKVAVLHGTEFRVETVRLPDNLTDEEGITLPHVFSGFLKQTLKDLNLPKETAALALPPGQVICRLVTLPVMNQEQLTLNLPYEFADLIQGAPEQYFCDYAMCSPAPGDEEGTMSMMAAVAARKHLEGYIRMFAGGGVKLKRLVPQEMALVELCRSLARQGGPEEFCFVDLGHRQTRITVVAGDRVQATRSLSIGGRDLDMAIADELGVDIFLANSYKTAGNRQAMETAAISELCQRLAVEILKVVNFYQFTYRSNTLEGLYLVGGGAALGLLRQAIENTVEMPLLDPAKLLRTSSGLAADGIFAAGAVMGGV